MVIFDLKLTRAFKAVRRDPSRAARCQPWIAAALLCLAVLLGPTAGHAIADEADRQFTFAARLMQRGESQLATDAFAKFIRQYDNDPRVSDAHYYLALLARQRGDLDAARAHLDRVTDPLNVGKGPLNMMRGQVKLESGDARGAVADLEKIDPAKLPDDESRAAWSYLLGTAYRGVGNLPAAAKQFDTASEAASAVRGQALLELAKVRIELEQSAAAVEALTEALRTDLDAPLAAEALGLAADLTYQQGQYQRTADLYQQIIQRHQTSPQFEPALIGQLRALYGAGQDEQLLKQYQATHQLLSADAQAEALYLTGAAHVRLGDYQRGAAALREFYRRFGAEGPLAGEVAYLYALCLYHTDPGGLEKWIAGITNQLADMPHRDDLRYLRAQAAVKRERIGEAVEHLTPLIEEPDNAYSRRALLQRAALHEQSGTIDAAAADYALYAQRYPKDAKALDAGRRAIALAFGSGRFDRVVELARPWLGQEQLAPPTRAPVRFQLAVSLIKLGQTDAALNTLDQLLTSEPSPQLAAYAHYYRGLILAARATPSSGDQSNQRAVEPALAALESALQGPLPDTQKIEAMALIARLHRTAGREEEAIKTYEQLRQQQPMSQVDPSTAVWVGRGLHESGRHEAALGWLTSVTSRKDAPPAAVAEALFLAAESHRIIEQWDQAIDAYRRLVAYSRGYGDQGRLGLARSLAGAGRTDEALNEYNGLISVEASPIAAAALLESALLHRDLARRLAAAGDGPSAQTQRTEARKRLSRVTILYDLPQLKATAGRALLTLGQMHAKAGDPQRARHYFEQVIDRPDPTVWHEAARAERSLLDGRRGEAVFILRRMLEAAGDAPASLQSDEDHAYARRRLRQLGENPGTPGATPGATP